MSILFLENVWSMDQAVPPPHQLFKLSEMTSGALQLSYGRTRRRRPLGVVPVSLSLFYCHNTFQRTFELPWIPKTLFKFSGLEMATGSLQLLYSRPGRRWPYGVADSILPLHGLHRLPKGLLAQQELHWRRIRNEQYKYCTSDWISWCYYS